jgi:hypothetical protein
MDVGREAAAGHTAERAAAAGGMVLLTLASARFLMTLHSSVRNALIGFPHEHGRQGRSGPSPHGCLRHRVRHLRVRVADHRAG